MDLSPVIRSDSTKENVHFKRERGRRVRGRDERQGRKEGGRDEKEERGDEDEKKLQ